MLYISDHGQWFKMGEVVGQPNDFWTFDGINSYFPIELMIHQVENEYDYHSRFGKNLCERAWSLIESSESSPTGIWKAKVKDRYGDMTSCQWSTMKNDLLDAFGRSSLQPYSFQEKFDFLHRMAWKNFDFPYRNGPEKVRPPLQERPK